MKNNIMNISLAFINISSFFEGQITKLYMRGVRASSHIRSFFMFFYFERREWQISATPLFLTDLDCCLVLGHGAGRKGHGLLTTAIGNREGVGGLATRTSDRNLAGRAGTASTADVLINGGRVSVVVNLLDSQGGLNALTAALCASVVSTLLSAQQVGDQDGGEDTDDGDDDQQFDEGEALGAFHVGSPGSARRIRLFI